GVPHVSVGTLLRRSIDEGDPLGVSEFLDQGTLVPDEITEKLLFPNLGEGFVLDGYPRSLQQAIALDEYLDSVGRPLDAAAELVGREPVLEIGIGTGRIAVPMVDKGSSIVGIDLSRPMLARLIEKTDRRPRLAIADATRPPFRDAAFGAAYGVHVLHLIPN